MVFIYTNTNNLKSQQITQENNSTTSDKKTELIQPMTFLEKAQDPLIPNESGLIDPMVFYDENGKIIPMSTMKSEGRTTLQECAQSSSTEQSQVTDYAPYNAAYICTPNVQSAALTVVSGNTAKNGSLVARLQKSGLIPPPSTSDYSVTVYNVDTKVNQSRITPTPMDLVKKVKQCLSLCVKDHKIFLCIDGYYKPMAQNDMEEVIWAVCRAEVDKVGNKAILSGAYHFLTIDPDLRADDLVSSQNVVPFQNGLIRLDTGFFMPLIPSYFITFTLNCTFPLGLSSVACPAFDNYLDDVSGGDHLLVRRIWQFIGYCLTQDTNAKAIFVLQGVSSSGKSVLVNLLKAIFPKEVVTALDAHDMGEKYAVGECENKLLCISSDMPADALGGKAVSNLKKLSGRDTVSSAVKYKGRKDFNFTGKIIMVTNNPLLLKQDDPAFWARIVVIPFRYQIPKERRINNLEDLLIAEMPGIAAKALDAYFDLRRNGYQFSGDYEVNSIDMYANSKMITDPTAMIYLYLQQHYEPWGNGIVILEEAYKDFIALNGISISTQQFSSIFRKQAIEMYGAIKIRTREGGYQNARSAIKGIKRKFI